MQTSLTKAYAASQAGQDANSILRKCVHCGFCNATCPTYQLLGDELDGPRGRIYLIKQVLEGNNVSQKTQTHLDRCLTCRNCETTCPSGVEYGRLLDTGRQILSEKVSRSFSQKVFRNLLRKLMLNRGLFTALVSTGQLVKRTMPAILTNAIPAKANSQLNWPTQKHDKKILLVQGCVQNAFQPDIDKAAAIVFNKLNYETDYITSSQCCGAINHHLSAEHDALKQMKKNIDAWYSLVAKEQIEAITMTASGCGAHIKEYGHILKNDPDYAEKANAISELYKDPVEIIQPRINELSCKSKQRIAFHPPCTYQHGMKLLGTIENTLDALGINRVIFNNSHLCCGSAGTYSITQKAISQQLLTNKVEAIEATQPDLILTANIGCLLHLQNGTKIPVKHWLEVLTDH